MRHSSIKINPLNDREPISKEVGQLSVDIYHKDKEIVILAPRAGVEEADVKISITDDVLVIKGERRSREEVPENAYYTRECFWGNFSRSIVLPEDAWMVEDNGSVIMGASQSNIFWLIIYDIFLNTTGEILSGHLSVLGQQQMNNLIDNGYE